MRRSKNPFPRSPPCFTVRHYDTTSKSGKGKKMKFPVNPLMSKTKSTATVTAVQGETIQFPGPSVSDSTNPQYILHITRHIMTNYKCHI